jgi:hypothetical protein
MCSQYQWCSFTRRIRQTSEYFFADSDVLAHPKFDKRALYGTMSARFLSHIASISQSVTFDGTMLFAL